VRAAHTLRRIRNCALQVVVAELRGVTPLLWRRVRVEWGRVGQVLVGLAGMSPSRRKITAVVENPRLAILNIKSAFAVERANVGVGLRVVRKAKRGSSGVSATVYVKRGVRASTSETRYHVQRLGSRLSIIISSTKPG
jgi:hypothetical protein